jgi:hypothetical protein
MRNQSGKEVKMAGSIKGSGYRNLYCRAETGRFSPFAGALAGMEFQKV